MRLIITISLMLIVAGCSMVVPTKHPKFPDVPQQLTEQLPDLAPLDPNKRKPKDLLDNAAENYGVCYRYIERARAWEDWYKNQKSLYEKYQ